MHQNTLNHLPVGDAGTVTKKRGLVIRSASELNEFSRILANEKLAELARRRVDEVQSPVKKVITCNLFQDKYFFLLHFLSINKSKNPCHMPQVRDGLALPSCFYH